MITQQATTVHEHPAYVPEPVPPAPQLALSNGKPAPTLGELLFLPLNEIARVPAEYVNLACATMLPDTQDLDIPACLKTFSEWSAHVRRETDRCMHQFRRAPAKYNDSEAYYRVIMMVTVLQQDFGVRYNPGVKHSDPWLSSREGFLHGLLTGDKTGTCASMPVLYTAMGRRLGYPIYLVHAKGHLLCRWHSAKSGERFNIEASGIGLNVYPDSQYHTWPLKITDAEVHHGVYLRNLDPAEEFGHYMATRGHCLRDRGHLLDSLVAYTHAHRLAPTNPHTLAYLIGAMNEELDSIHSGKLPVSYRHAEEWDKSFAVQRFTLNENYAHRVAGLNAEESVQAHLKSSLENQ